MPVQDSAQTATALPPDRRECRSAPIPNVGYHQRVAEKAAQYTPPQGTVVDIGAGSGNVLAILKRLRPDAGLIAADLNEDYLALVRDRVADVRTLKITEDLPELLERPEQYDTIIMCHSLEHTMSPPLVLRRCLHALKSGGHLVLAVPNPVRPQVFFGNIRQHHYVETQHVYAWDRSHWMNFLERIMGLDVVEHFSDEVRFIPRPVLRRMRWLGRLEWALARLVPWWSFSNMSVIVKPPVTTTVDRT